MSARARRRQVAALVIGACALVSGAVDDAHTPVPAAPTPSTPRKEPAAQELIFYNARMALREGKAPEALRLWMLHNALLYAGEPSAHERDFRSVVWAALGETGFCPDGFAEDDDGAGLWPLAMHNWLLKNLRRQDPAPQPTTWGTFAGGMQQRRFSLHDVLSLEELKSTRFYRASCLAPVLMIPRLQTLQWIDMADRLRVGLMMRDLIEVALRTLSKDNVEGRALLLSRRFDLNAALTRMAKAKVRKDATITGQLLRAAGVTENGWEPLRLQRLEGFYGSEQADLWRKALSWTPQEWLALSEQRRLALFADLDEALPATQAKVRDGLVVRMVDALIAKGMGRELEQWLGFIGASAERIEAVRSIAEGERGERVLALEPATGFRERSAIALHRGVRALQEGDTLRAMRAFAFALAHAGESQEAERVHSLAQRWFAFVLGHHETDDKVIAILDALVPAIDRPVFLEGLLWRAAFRADTVSFEKIAQLGMKKSGIGRTIDILRPLSRGDAGKMWTTLKTSSEGETAAIVVFAGRMVEHLSIEPLEVRAHNVRTLQEGQRTLAELDPRPGTTLHKKVEGLRQRLQSVLDGIGQADETVWGRAESSAIDRETYVGSVRLAPADELPWPFIVRRMTAPDPFAPLQLDPVEWRRGQGDLIYGWRIHE